MDNLLTFREAGKKLGVNRSALKQLLKDGLLPEAEKIRRPEGWVWMLPAASIEQLSKHPSLVIDVRNEETEASINDTGEPQADEVLTEQDTVRHLTLAANQTAAEANSVAEVIDMALLDRLLSIQEAKTVASCRAEQAEYALEAAQTHYSSVEEELSIERKERTTTSERLREERLARKIADVKIAELNEQLIRETTIAEAERKERIAATNRTMSAEQKASYAVASMSWLAKRKYMKSLKSNSEL